MADLRAGLIGYGQMGRHHARVLRTLPGVQLAGVADEASADDDPSLLGVPMFSEVGALLEAGIDLAVVAVPTLAHEPIALELARAGVHALIEKPIAMDVESARRIGTAFEDAGLVACVGHIERYNPALQEMRRRLAFGELGEIYQIATRRQGPFPERVADVGVVLDLATHDVDLTAWVAKKRYTSISARTANRSGREHEDLVAAVGLLEGDIVVDHLVNWLSPLKERVTVVTGERGALVADTLTADLTYFSNGVAPVKWDTLASFRGVVQGDVIRYAIPKREPLLVELEAFRDAVLGRDSRIVSICDATHTVAVAQAMLRSAKGGLVEELSSKDR